MPTSDASVSASRPTRAVPASRVARSSMSPAQRRCDDSPPTLSNASPCAFSDQIAHEDALGGGVLVATGVRGDARLVRRAGFDRRERQSNSVLAASDSKTGYLGYTERVMGKVLVSFDDALLRRIDRAASSRGLTRSAYLAQLAERDAARATGPGKTPAVQAALRDLDRLFADAPPGESTAAIRAARDPR